MTNQPSNERTTFRIDQIRGALAGVIETGYGGFALVVAIGFFEAPDTVKGIVAAASPLGLLFTPLSLSWFSRMKAPVGHIASSVSIFSGVLLLGAAFAKGLLGFLIPACLSFALAAQITPLLVHIWAENYPANKRGAYLSISMMLSVAAAFCFSMFGGWLLDYDIEMYRWVLGVIAVCYLLTGIVLWKVPSTPLQRSESQNPFRNLGYAIEDKVFGVMLLGWMFLGFGNLMVLPLRVEYLLQPEYGIMASKLWVMLITIAIPAFFRFVTSRFWGYFFDRIDFMILRMVLNAMIMLSILLFLTTQEMWVIVCAAAVLGTAMAGANLSWSLWVTKFAPPAKAPAYMSVHTFLTGVRGVLAPFLGFYVISGIGAKGTAYLGASLVFCSIVIVYLLFRSQQQWRATRTKTS